MNFSVPLSRITSVFLASAAMISFALAADPLVLTAPDLAARTGATGESGPCYIRLKMEIQEPVGTPKTTLQLLIKERQTANGNEAVYQVLWPEERKGESVLLREHNGKISGTVFVPPNTMREIKDGDEALFGSDLSYRDVMDDFYSWDRQTFAGTETIDNVPCQILESKPGSGQSSPYGSVRSWIDTARFVPLRIEKYSPSGSLLKTIETMQVAKDDLGRFTPAKISVRSGENSLTILDGSRIRHDVTYTDADFTPEGLKEVKPPTAKAKSR